MIETYTDIFKGVVSVAEENGVYTPFRLTQKQLERYKGLPKCPFSNACAGIKMEFITDAHEISFGYTYRSIWTHFEGNTPTFDFYVNGVFADAIKIEMDKLGEKLYMSFKFEKELAENKITVYLPHNAAVSIFDLSIGNYTLPAEKKRKLLVLGDSISQGLMGDTSSVSYTENYARFFDMEILNLSVGGDCYDETAIDEELPYKPTDIIIALGTNDVAMICDYELIVANMKKYMNKISSLYPDCDITVITPPAQLTWEETDIEKHKMIEDFRGAIRLESEKYGFLCLDAKKLLPAAQRFYTDDAHPNDSGFSQYALNLIKAKLQSKG